MVQRLVCRSAIRHSGCSARPVALRPDSDDFRWRLLRIQEEGWGDFPVSKCTLFLSQSFQAPVRTNQIPRQVPEQTLYTKFLPGMLMGGILPFGCIFIQLFFILNSIWSVFFSVVPSQKLAKMFFFFGNGTKSVKK